MAFPPGVTIKDFQSERLGRLSPNPKPGGQPPRFKSIIQIVPVTERCALRHQSSRLDERREKQTAVNASAAVDAPARSLPDVTTSGMAMRLRAAARYASTAHAAITGTSQSDAPASDLNPHDQRQRFVEARRVVRQRRDDRPR